MLSPMRLLAFRVKAMELLANRPDALLVCRLHPPLDAPVPVDALQLPGLVAPRLQHCQQLLLDRASAPLLCLLLGFAGCNHGRTACQTTATTCWKAMLDLQ